MFCIKIEYQLSYNIESRVAPSFNIFLLLNLSVSNSGINTYIWFDYLEIYYVSYIQLTMKFKFLSICWDNTINLSLSSVKVDSWSVFLWLSDEVRWNTWYTINLLSRLVGALKLVKITLPWEISKDYLGMEGSTYCIVTVF